MLGDVEIFYIKLDFFGIWCMRLIYVCEGVNNNLRCFVLERFDEMGVNLIIVVYDNWYLNELGVIYYMYID